MKIFKSTIIMTVSAALLLMAANCGQNPFGSGFSKGLRFFALFGKAMKKPEEEKNKEEAKAMANDAVGKLLAKSSGELSVMDQWTRREVVDSAHPDFPNRLIYLVEVENKPDDRDPLKVFTGKAWVVYTRDALNQIRAGLCQE